MKFIAIDFETSGLDPKRHAPVSLGVALFDGEEMVFGKEWVISPPMKDGKVTREYDVCALQVSGTSWKDIKCGSAIASVLGEIPGILKDHEFRNDSLVVAFNAPFDLAFYSESCFIAGNWNQHLRRFESFVPPLIGPWQCVRMLALDRLTLPRYDLDTVSAHFALSRDGAKHGALEDAILAGQLFLRLCEKATIKTGVE